MAAAVSFLGRGSSAPTLLKLPLVSPAVSPYGSPERPRPGFDTCVHDPSWADRLQSQRLQPSRQDATPAAHPSLAALLSLCEASDRIDAFVEQGFTAAAHVVQDLNEDGLTIVLVTHDQSLVEFADKHYHMVDGAISD